MHLSVCVVLGLAGDWRLELGTCQHKLCLNLNLRDPLVCAGTVGVAQYWGSSSTGAVLPCAHIDDEDMHYDSKNV